MNNISTANLDYFETDQVKLSVRLWKLTKAAHGDEFNVLSFTQNWQYADDVLAKAIVAKEQPVSDCALEIMQLRMLFVQRYPERARKMGARISDSDAAQSATTPAAPDAPKEPDPKNRRYMRGVR